MTEDEQKEKKLREPILGVDGPIIRFMTKVGHIIILNIIWLICCIPVFTIGSATTSFYYAMIKNVRHDRGYPVSEFFGSFKRTFWSGSIITIVTGIWLAVLYYLRMIAQAQENDHGIFLDRMYITLMVVIAAILIYLFPVLSRFTMSLSKMVKLSFVMMFRFFGFTLIILGCTAGMAWLYFYYLPIPVIFFLPGIWCYLCTYMIEIALKKYMPEPNGDEDAWYYE